MAETVQYYGTGRRKTSVARVYLRPGSGDYKVNGRPFNEYFVTEAQRASARQPLLSTDTAGTFNAELRKKLKTEGMVTRDSRGKERKKYGQKGARKRFQFSKR